MTEMNIIFANIDVLQWAVVVIGYIITLATSGLLVRYFVGGASQETSNADSERAISGTNYNIGTLCWL